MGVPGVWRNWGVGNSGYGVNGDGVIGVQGVGGGMEKMGCGALGIWGTWCMEGLRCGVHRLWGAWDMDEWK